MSFERYLAGNRVYRHGSSAPTMGTVNPSGYVERELRKRRMLTPQSQTRSGLAGAALDRLRSSFGGSGQAGPVTQMPQIQRPGDATLNAKLAATRAEHLAQMQQAQQAMQQKLASRPRVSPVGKVTAPGQVKKKPAPPRALPWDMDAMNAKIAAQQALGKLRNEITMGRQNQAKSYAQQLMELNRAQPEARRNLLNNFAGRGLPFSSGYGLGVGDVENRFASARGELENENTSTLNNFLNQGRQGEADFREKLAVIQQALAMRLSKNAGNLGLGRVPAAKPKPKKKAVKK